MFGFFKKKAPKEEGILALDIGSEVVKAVVFTIEEKQSTGGEVIGKKAVIQGFSKVCQQPENIQSGAMTDVTKVIQNCKNAIAAASNQARIRPSKMVLGIGGEFIKGATLQLSYKREDSDTKINLMELRNIVHKLQWQAFGEIRKQVSDETGYAEIDVKLVSADITDIRIDGYKVSNPLGFQGKEVKMSIFNSFAPVGHFTALHNIAYEFNMDLLGIISEPYAISRLMGEGERGGASAIFMNIGGVNTDVVVVEKGAMLGSKMFAIGGRTFTKRLAVELNISFEEAEKLKFSYTDDKLESKSKKIIADIVQQDVEVWLEGIVFALSEFKKKDSLPSKILLCGGGTYLPEIKESLNNRKWHKKLPFTSKPQAAFMHVTDAVNVIDDTKKLNDSQDMTSLALVSIGIDLSGAETIVQKALRKVIGIMKV